jgi:hypothetical protein
LSNDRKPDVDPTRRIGQSLQEYLLAFLDEHASRPTLEEVLWRAGERAAGSVPLADAAKVVRTERNSR